MINYISSINETDKFIGSISKNPKLGHNYKPIYSLIFNNNPLDKILEIGTASCGFAKFLKDNGIGSFLVGADIKRGIVSYHIQSRLTWEHLFDDFFEGDVASEIFRQWVSDKKYKFDLIIDDASHEPQLQKYLLQICDDLLTNTGIYIVEDIRSYQQAVDNFNSIPKHLKIVSYIVDLSLSNGRSDDICIVIDKRNL